MLKKKKPFSQNSKTLVFTELFGITLAGFWGKKCKIKKHDMVYLENLMSQCTEESYCKKKYSCLTPQEEKKKNKKKNKLKGEIKDKKIRSLSQEIKLTL